VIRPTPDAYLVQVVLNGECWEHRWWVPRWGDPDPTVLDGTAYQINGVKHPDMGTYRVKPFYADAPAQAMEPGDAIERIARLLYLRSCNRYQDGTPFTDWDGLAENLKDYSRDEARKYEALRNTALWPAGRENYPVPTVKAGEVHGDALEVLDAECSAINRIRHDLGKWLQRMEDTNWQVNGSGGPDELTLSDLNHAVVRLRGVRAAIAVGQLGAVPAGWKLVPELASEEQLRAALDTGVYHDGEDAARAVLADEYRTMVAAAPPAHVIDLGQVRYLAQWVKDGCNFLECDPAKLDNAARDLLRVTERVEAGV
jgi:hypothetical protein